MTRPIRCKRPQAGGEYMEGSGPYMLLCLGCGLDLVELSVDAAQALQSELGEAIDQAHRLRHQHQTVPIRFEEDVR